MFIRSRNFQTKTKFFSLLICVVVCLVFFVSDSNAQTPKITTREDWGIPEAPLNCEGNLSYLETAAQRTLEELGEGKLLIIIARRGKNENKSKINSRRLHNIRISLVENLKIPAQYIIFTEGEPIDGFGQVGFYLSGRLIGALTVKRNKDICVDCCEMDNRYYPYRQTKKKSSFVRKSYVKT